MSNLLFRAATDASDTSFTTNSITGVVPTGTAAGDAQFAIVTGGSIAPAAAPTFTTPSGWVLLGSSSQFPLAGGLINLREWVFTRKAGASEVNQAFTASANCAMGIIRASYQNPDPNGFAGQVVFGNSSSGTTVAVGPLTTTRLNSLLLAFITQGTAQSITPAAGFTERLDNPTSGISIADAIQAAIGSSGTKNFTIPTSGDAAWAFIEGYSNNTVTNVEAITFSDSQTGVAKFVGLVGESISLSESQVAAAHFTGASLESITFADATDGVFRQFGDLAETISLSDDQDAVLVSGSIATETVSFADSVDGVLDGSGAVDESVLFSDSVAGAFAGVDSIGESIIFVDGQIGQFHAVGAVGESISLSEVIGSAAVFAGLQDESIAFVDVVDGTTPGQEQVVEQITLLDDQTATSATSGQVGEFIAFMDQVLSTGGQPDTPFGGGFFSVALRRKLFEEEMREKLAELPPQVAEVIENTVIESIDRPKKPTQKELRQAFERENVPYREAYRKAVVSLVQEMRQREEDDEEEEAIALAIASLI